MHRFEMNEKLASPNRRRALKITQWVMGLLLLGAAIGLAVNSVAFSTLSQTSPWQWGVMIIAIVGNCLLTGWLFTWVHKAWPSSQPIRSSIMIRLISLSVLLNYIPFIRLGLWARAEYLKRDYEVRRRDSVAVLIVVLLLSTAVVCVTAVTWLGLNEVDVGYALLYPLLFIGWLLCGVITGVVLQFSASVRSGIAKDRLWKNATVWSWGIWRGFDVMFVALRLWIACQVVGLDVSYDVALLLACLSVLGRLIAITPNGLGLSEWLVVAVGTVINPEQTGLLAAAVILDRSIEVLTLIPVGLACAISLKRKHPTESHHA